MALRILGVGNPFVDVFSQVEDEFPASIGVHPGSSSHWPYGELEPILLALPDPVFVSGGGAASVMKIASWMGVDTAFSGAVGADPFAELFSREMEEAGVRLWLKRTEGRTGAGVVLRCRSGQRSFLYSPASSVELGYRDVSDESIAWADWIYLEGFLLSRPEFLISILNRASLAGKGIAFDLGSWRLVQESRELAREIVEAYADITFANEAEFMALANASLEEALEFFRPDGRQVVVKRGAEGALLLRGDDVYRSPGRSAAVVDETNAGDAFAAGFLAALSRGLDSADCLSLGNQTAALSLGYPCSSVEGEKLSKL